MMTTSQLDDDNVSIQLVPHVLVVRSVQYNSEIVRACLPTPNANKPKAKPLDTSPNQK